MSSPFIVFTHTVCKLRYILFQHAPSRVFIVCSRHDACHGPEDYELVEQLMTASQDHKSQYPVGRLSVGFRLALGSQEKQAPTQTAVIDHKPYKKERLFALLLDGRIHGLTVCSEQSKVRTGKLKSDQGFIF